jgi:2-polyprenyl-3-methyl-5-hydroxy-6-metoxy-1,4-benzoquinol methylase
MKRVVVRLLDPVIGSRPGEAVVTTLFRLWVSATTRLETRSALRKLYRADDLLQSRIDLLAIRLDGGIHPKHRIMRYHDFFLARIHPGESVLDVGCGKGELAYDLAERGGARVTGIDTSPDALEFARSRFASERLELLQADALTWTPPHPFDVVVLSNVLEHIADRVLLLERLVALARPSRMLIRVPVLERDWQVILRRELGLPYFSDPTHETEYDERQLEDEARASGLVLAESQRRWGEIWAVAEPLPT